MTSMAGSVRVDGQKPEHAGKVGYPAESRVSDGDLTRPEFSSSDTPHREQA
ncbi:uncharacterized protein CMC5_012860 [Chondromyces crocatus]|uniref:Uncharacterized protein n=1 Tax=Chondromyces crocatus TaxID=52 RepID=A0A0K1E8F5_CHOCO|nr:uncharacterized protein CMC5_012860 [Chondromyces crocatus]